MKNSCECRRREEAPKVNLALAKLTHLRRSFKMHFPRFFGCRSLLSVAMNWKVGLALSLLLSPVLTGAQLAPASAGLDGDEADDGGDDAEIDEDDLADINPRLWAAALYDDSNEQQLGE